MAPTYIRKSEPNSSIWIPSSFRPEGQDTRPLFSLLSLFRADYPISPCVSSNLDNPHTTPTAALVGWKVLTNAGQL